MEFTSSHLSSLYINQDSTIVVPPLSSMNIADYKYLLLLLSCLILGGLLFEKTLSWIRWNQKMARHGCKPMVMYPQWDPIFGLDLFLTTLKSIKNHMVLAKSNDRFKQCGKSFGFFQLRTRFFATIDVENIQAVLSTSSKSFELGSRRRNAMAPLLGRGVFGTDGEQWRHSRAMLRPNFTKYQMRGFDMPEDHVQHLLALIPENEQEVVDLQNLFHKFTMDTATEFLLGQAVGSLSLAKSNTFDTFSHSFKVSMQALTTAIRLGPAAKCFTSREVAKAQKQVHAFVQKFIDETLEAREKRTETNRNDLNDSSSGGRYVFLHELIKVTSDPLVIRDEVLSALAGGRDTTASLLSNLFFCLARDSRVWEKLREEVCQLPPKFDQAELARLRYTNMCISECKSHS